MENTLAVALADDIETLTSVPEVYPSVLFRANGPLSHVSLYSCLPQSTVICISTIPDSVFL